MVVVPPVTPVTTPVVLMLATVGVLDVHTPPLTASDSVVLAFEHITLKPVIGFTSALGVIVTVRVPCTQPTYGE